MFDFGRLKLDLGQFNLARVVSTAGVLANLPFRLLPLLACILIYALSTEYIVPFEPSGEDSPVRPLSIQFGYLAIPVAIGAAYLFGYAIPTILIATLPLGAFTFRVTEVLTIGPGFDMALVTVLVSGLTVYLRDADFLANPPRCHDCVRAVLALGILYSAFFFHYRGGEGLVEFRLGSGYAEVIAIILALLVKLGDDRGSLRRFYWFIGLVTAFLFIDGTGLPDLMTGGNGGRLTLRVGALGFGFTDWVLLLTEMLFAAGFARLIRAELAEEDRISDGALFALFAACVLFYLFRYRLSFGAEIGLRFAIFVPSVFVYLAAGLVGYRLGRSGIIWVGVILVGLVLVVYGVNALIPLEDWSRIVFLDGTVGYDYRLRSYMVAVRTAPLPLVLTGVAMAFWGLVLRRRVEALKAPKGDKFLRQLSR